MDQKILLRLDRHDWEDSIIRLAAYAVSLCRWLPEGLPGGLEPEDLVMEAIGKVYNGVRKWDPEKDPDLNLYLMSVVKSILYNTLKLAKNRIGSVMFTEEEVPDPAADPETEMYADQLDQYIAMAMRGDPELCLVYKALKDGLKPAEIAGEYALEETRVRNAQKRLNRLATKVIHLSTKSAVK
jgi:RNA polymerase sigma factor (sigma-70 family)